MTGHVSYFKKVDVMSNIQVIKRDGTKENINLDKLHKVVFHACEGVSGVSPSEV